MKPYYPKFAHGQEELRPFNAGFSPRNAMELIMKQPYFSPQSSNNSPINKLTLENLRTVSALKAQSTSLKLFKASPNQSKDTPMTTPKSSTIDWSPLDDAISITLPSSSGKSASREEVDLCIHNVLYGPTQKKRLPVFVDICPE